MPLDPMTRINPLMCRRNLTTERGTVPEKSQTRSKDSAKSPPKDRRGPVPVRVVEAEHFLDPHVAAEPVHLGHQFQCRAQSNSTRRRHGDDRPVAAVDQL